MLENLPIKDLEIMFSDSFNYEKIRLEAVKLFKEINPNCKGISEKGRIFYNPFRIYMTNTSTESTIESLFDVEIIDINANYEDLKFYKKCFIKAFDNLLKDKKLVSAKQILQTEW